MKRQEELLMEEGEGVGDGRAEGSATGDGGELQFYSHLTLMGRVLFPAGFTPICPLEKRIQ